MKTGRNQPCPCGSGKKYKRCHGSVGASPYGQKTPVLKRVMNPPPHILAALRRHQLQEHRRQALHGKGRPVISAEAKDYRFMAVGNVVHYGRWKTMHDFLFDFIKKALGPDWGNAEIKKPLAERHPILQWYDELCRVQQNPDIITPDGIRSSPITGAVAAYLGLAYNLYLLSHNVELQAELIRRLKQKSQFHGAYYETHVAAVFIRAGYKIAFENEQDNTRSHVEFTATHSSGRQYSVECKARHISGVLGASRGAKNPAQVAVHMQLLNALSKEANHTRVVFIDVNVPDDASTEIEVAWLKSAIESVETQESTMVVNGAPAPPAYVMLTNLPYHHAIEEKTFRTAIAGCGFKIPDFKMNVEFASLDEAIAARKKHSDMREIIEAFGKHEVPSTFDGSIPEFSFGSAAPPPKIGEWIEYEAKDGNLERGQVTDAIVSEETATMHISVHNPQTNTSTLLSKKMDAVEMDAYKRDRDTYFGVYKKVRGNIDNPVDLYEFFQDCYKDTPREQLLKIANEHPRIDELSKLSREELLHELCKGWVYGAMAQAKPKPKA